MPRLVDLNVYGESYTTKRDNVCKLFVLGYDLCITKYHVQCNGGPAYVHGGPAYVHIRAWLSCSGCSRLPPLASYQHPLTAPLPPPPPPSALP